MTLEEELILLFGCFTSHVGYQRAKKIFNLDVNTIWECDHLSNIFAFGPAVAKFAEIF